MAIVSPFFDLYPKIDYDINRRVVGEYTENLTNIFFRIGYIKDVVNNISSYVEYEIQEGDTPEIIAEKFYNDTGAGWMVILANQILDPQFDWPIDQQSFDRHIVGKYGSVSNAKGAVHHYEKVIERTVDDVVTVSRYVINKQRLTENDLIFPYNYYESYSIETYKTADSGFYKADSGAITADLDWDAGETDLKGGSLATRQIINTYNINGKTINEVIYGEPIYTYDYEVALNEAKRNIKVIRLEYYTQIMNEFKILTKSKPSYIRSFV